MDQPQETLSYLPLAVVLLAAAVVSVPIARALKLSAIIAYLVAGVLIGPFGLGVFRAPQTVLTVAELGVVMLLFLIGLELEFSRLFKMRRDIFGLGAAQLALTALVIGAITMAIGSLTWRGAAIAGVALAMSATTIALRMLEERGDLHTPYGERAFAILLFQDMAVVPLLALLPLLAPYGIDDATRSLGQTLGSIALVAAAIAAVVIAGRYLLNPLFRLLAGTGAREVMTAAALLVVLGTALLMHEVGMSMALGAFLAGVLLAESNYRHELEADLEPFRGLLLALFFMGVGMSIDVALVRANLWLVLAAAIAITLLKAAIVAILFRATCARREDAVRAGSVLTAAGEFAFVLLPLGGTLGVLSPAQASLLTAVAAVTMLLSTPAAALTDLLLRRFTPAAEAEPDNFDGVRGTVLMIGFGRFGQVVSQCLLAEGIDVTIIDNNAARIENAGKFGFKIYYGDGTRLDVLRAAGAEQARLIAVCVDDRAAAIRITDLVRSEFDGTQLYVRSYDRPHALELIAHGVDYEIRETVESAITFGRDALIGLGLDPQRARETEVDVRRRDRERLALQRAEGLYAGIDMLHTRPVQPTPLVKPRRQTRALNPEAGDIIRESESRPS
jgi:glutathione-regulated potassium-efflux system protein KefB